MSAVAPDRLNVSLLLDRNLDAGRGDKPALVGETGTLTYAELARLTARAAALLSELGIAREHRLLMVLDDSPVFHATFLGAIRIGAVPIPVNPMDRADNYAYYLDDSYAKLILVESSLLEKLESVLAERPAVRALVANGDAGAHTSFDEAVTAQPDELEPPVDTHPDDMAFWLYSSGSTGRPKGVVHRQADVAVTIDTYARHVLRITDADVCYSTTKLFHAYGLGNGLSFPLSAGATAVQVPGPSSPDRILETVARHTPTLLFSVPALYAAMLKSPRAGETDFSSVRACVSAAEALPAAVQARWQELTGVPILDGIGSTEMLHIYCSNTLDDLRPGTSGRPVPGYELRVVDEEGRDVPAGEPGNLLVRGDSCAPYYWHQRSKTRQCMRGDWFFTGDRYVKTPEGYFAYQGRADDMIKAGGLWVSPADMEACLVAHPAVSEAAVIGVQVDDVSRIKAFVICAEPPADPDALAEELRQWCKERLRRYEYPHVVAFVDDLPRTPTGKIQRYKLRDAERLRPASEAAAAPVSTATA
jgi:benzoate-CoA ligase family protein